MNGWMQKRQLITFRAPKTEMKFYLYILWHADSFSWCCHRNLCVGVIEFSLSFKTTTKSHERDNKDK
jgi:hypothetical protein